MNARPPYSTAASKILRCDDNGVRPDEPRRRAATIEALTGAIRAHAHLRRRRRIALGVAALTAAAAVIIATHSLHRHSPPRGLAVERVDAVAFVVHAFGNVTLVRAGAARPLVDAAAIGPGDHVVVASGARADVALSTGTRLSMVAGELAVIEAGITRQILSLLDGVVRADVAKLRDGERFVIRTIDVEVEVRGTSFEVARVFPDPGCRGGVTTRVGVREGVVLVRHRGIEERIVAGERWPRECAPAAPAPTASVSSVATLGPVMAAPPKKIVDKKPAVASSPVAAAASPMLAEQNAAYRVALDAKHRGDAAAAIAAFASFEAKYPASPLAESAMIERMRLTADRARAASIAKAYLVRYPVGLARKEAEQVAAAAP